MSALWPALPVAVFAWWFFTGAIMLAVRQADRRGGCAHAMTTLAAVPLLALGVAGIVATAGQDTAGATYLAFLSALAVWGWIELAFLAGIVTGPERRACPPGLSGWPRFTRALATLAHHEALLLAGLALVAFAASEGGNPTALWTYTVLFGARILAKLNLFFGVPRINVEFLPRPLGHLKSYFRRGPTTPVFAGSVTLLTLALACFLHLLHTAAPAAEAARHALLATLVALALLEHWLMVLPLPDAKLWRWMLPGSDTTATEREPTHGL